MYVIYFYTIGRLVKRTQCAKIWDQFNIYCVTFGQVILQIIFYFLICTEGIIAWWIG